MTLDPPASPRNPFLAGILSALVIGLGQLYNGQIAKAVRLWLIQLFFLLMLWPIQLQTHFWGLLALAIGGFLTWVYSIADAMKNARSPRPNSNPARRRYLMAIAAVVAVVLSLPPVRSALIGARAFRTPSEGMDPTLQVGDFFMTKLLSADAPIARGEILVFLYPPNPQVTYMKRVAGLPGEEVELRSGKLLVDGRTVEASWAQYDARGWTETFGPVVVPEDGLLMLGDNIANSADSRAWGPLPREYVIGRALYIYFSRDLGRIGRSVRSTK